MTGAPSSDSTGLLQPMRWMISRNTVGRSLRGCVKICSSTPCAPQLPFSIMHDDTLQQRLMLLSVRLCAGLGLVCSSSRAPCRARLQLACMMSTADVNSEPFHLGIQGLCFLNVAGKQCTETGLQSRLPSGSTSHTVMQPLPFHTCGLGDG